jgi:hypothetical protein
MPHATRYTGWIKGFANEIGVRLGSPTLLESAETGLKNCQPTGYLFFHLLEFSFCTSNRPSPKKLRYVIDVTKLDRTKVEKMIHAGISLLGYIPKEIRCNPAYRRLGDISNGASGHLLYGIGAEHTSDNATPILKTYWRLPMAIEELGFMLSGDEKATFEQLFNAVQTFWPGWQNARLVSIDYLSAGKNRFKVYLPQKDFTEPLSIADLCAFLLHLGWQVDLDIFLKLSFFLLDSQAEAAPTAYSVGFAIGRRPSIKVEIAAQAYFDDAKQALYAGCGLAQSLGLDTSPIQTGVAALAKNSPFTAPPGVEVICLDFYPNGGNRVTLYCRMCSNRL